MSLNVHLFIGHQTKMRSGLCTFNYLIGAIICYLFLGVAFQRERRSSSQNVLGAKLRGF